MTLYEEYEDCVCKFTISLNELHAYSWNKISLSENESFYNLELSDTTCSHPQS